MRGCTFERSPDLSSLPPTLALLEIARASPTLVGGPRQMLRHRGPSSAAPLRLALPLGGGTAWRALPPGLALPPPDPHPPSSSTAVWVC